MIKFRQCFFVSRRKSLRFYRLLTSFLLVFVCGPLAFANTTWSENCWQKITSVIEVLRWGRSPVAPNIAQGILPVPSSETPGILGNRVNRLFYQATSQTMTSELRPLKGRPIDPVEEILKELEISSYPGFGGVV